VINVFGRSSVRHSAALAIALAWIAVGPALRAQNTITNVMSPVASYQYFDSIATESNSQISSLSVAYQFYDSLTNAGTNSELISQVASLQYFDWPVFGTVPLLNALRASYYYYGDTSAPFITSSTLANGNEMIVTGASSSLNRPYYVLATTNLALPQTDWIIIATNQCDAYGYFTFTNQINTNLSLEVYSISAQ
jgi:hypothetical protein